MRTRQKIRPTQPSLVVLQIKKIVIWGGALIIMALIVSWLLKRFFLVREVICTINQAQIPCSESLNGETQKLKNQPMLFFNFDDQLKILKTQSLNFKSFNYTKVLPETLLVNFNFAPAIYQINNGAEVSFNFDQNGAYTLSPLSETNFRIDSIHQKTNNELNGFVLDPVLHQKFMELENFSQSQRDDWQKITFKDLNCLEIETSLAVFVLDLFNLDENLQKMAYLIDNWRPDGKEALVDLRFKLPVIKKR